MVMDVIVILIAFFVGMLVGIAGTLILISVLAMASSQEDKE